MAENLRQRYAAVHVGKGTAQLDGVDCADQYLVARALSQGVAAPVVVDAFLQRGQYSRQVVWRTS